MRKGFLHILVVAAFVFMQATAVLHNYAEHHSIAEHAQCELCHMYQGFSSLDTVYDTPFVFPKLENFYEISLSIADVPRSFTSSYFSQAPPLL